MPANTAHVMPKNGDWVVLRDGRGERSAGVYPTQKEAIEIAHEILHRQAGRIAIHGRDGSIRYTSVHAWPAVQPSKVKSSLGTKAIREAVRAVIRERLGGG